MNEDHLETVIAEFSERLRQGESPSVDEYVARYPDLAGEIKELLPTIADLERVKSRQERVTGELASLGPLKIEQLGDFHLIREIGRGGMGVVFEARQESLARKVAIKVLPRQPWQDAKQLEQFKQEAQVAAGLHHTNIVQIHGVGEDEGYHYYAMQLIEGKGLDRLIQWLADMSAGTTSQDSEQLGSLCKPIFGSPSELATHTSLYWHGVACIGLQVAEALAYAHDQGVIHRDIKPANLLVDPQGMVWITDFGLAHAAQAAGVTQPGGSMAGTLRYLAPEQFQGQVHASSDVYSLGVTLYELLTLTPAYDATDNTSLIRAITQSDPPRPRRLRASIPKDLETIVLKAMMRDPNHRYPSAQDLADDLRNYLQGLPIKARRLGPGERLWLWAKRNPAVATLSMAVTLCLMAASLIGWSGYYHTRQALKRESQQLQHTRMEYERAEANLNLALQAFEGVFGHMTPSAISVSSMQGEENPVYEPMVSARDVAILQDLLGFYLQFAGQNRNTSGLQTDIARASYRIGQIYNQLGQFQKAQEACRLTQHLTKGQEGADQNVVWLIKNGLELGWAIQMLGQHHEARDIYGDLRRRLEATSDPTTGSEERDLLLAQIHLRLGSMPMGQGQEGPNRNNSNNNPRYHTKTALQLSQDWLSRCPDHPGFRYTQALAYRSLAFLAYREADRDVAENYLTDAIEHLSDLHNQFPQQASYMYELAMIYSMEEGQAPPSPGASKIMSSTWKDRYQKALTLSDTLVLKYPTVPAYLALLSRAHLRLADVHLSDNDQSRAEDHLLKAHNGLSNLIKQDLTASSYICDYLKGTFSLGRLLLHSGELDESRQLLEKDLREIERMLENGPRRKREWVLLARHYSTLAEVYEALDDRPAARDIRRRERRIENEQSLFKTR
ncbi:protein kinase [Planctomycetota bacterium]